MIPPMNPFISSYFIKLHTHYTDMKIYFGNENICMSFEPEHKILMSDKLHETLTIRNCVFHVVCIFV